MRIVSLVPSHTEILFFLGLGDQVAGVSSHCDYPPEVERIERVGPFGSPDAEKIISLRPGLVLADGRLQGNCLDKLRQDGVRVFDFFPGTLDELFAGMEEIAAAAGKGEHSRQLIAGLKSRAEKLTGEMKGFPSRRVIFVMGSETLATPGPASIQFAAISDLGVGMYPAVDNSYYIPVTWEDVARFNPEILLVCGKVPGEKERKRCPGCSIKNRPCAREVESVYRNPVLAGVSALERGAVYTLPCRFFCRPGPRLLEGMEWLAGVIREQCGKPEP